MYNERMNEQELSIVVANEKEWRKMMFRKLESMEECQTNTNQRVVKLEVKNALFGSFFGFVGGILAAYINKFN